MTETKNPNQGLIDHLKREKEEWDAAAPERERLAKLEAAKPTKEERYQKTCHDFLASL
jgi:hypothetical protein